MLGTRSVNPSAVFAKLFEVTPKKTAIAKNKAYDEVYEFSKKISDNFLPESKAYHEIWLDGEKISEDNENN